MDLLSKFGKALGYPTCCTEAFRKGKCKVFYSGYGLCPDCEHLTREEVEQRLGRSLYSPPVWLERGDWETFTEADWERVYQEAIDLKLANRVCDGI